MKSKSNNKSVSADTDRLVNELVAQISSLESPTTDNVRLVRREFSREHAGAPAEMIIELAVKLVDRSDFLLRFVAYELILHHKPALASLDAKKLERLGTGLDSWVAVDTFASYLSGPAWREGQVPDRLIAGWARSPDRWWRRAALVSTVPLNNKARGGSGDVERTLCICSILVKDRDEMVVKALSWALRELAKRDAKAVNEFIGLHETSLSARVLREVNNKLRTGLKNPQSGKL
jgi:3-methyladenine DNA glycosylase AlkD